MSSITGDIGTGPSVAQQILVSTTGSHDIATYNVPPGSDVTLTLVSGGGGGGTGDNATLGGGGGGGGAGVIVVIPAALWAQGGALVVGAKGTGGVTAPADGTDGGASTLTINSVLFLSLTGGGKGKGATHLGGAGGVPTVDPSLTPAVARKGYPGTTATSAAAGPGGAGALPGSGSGGAGGTGSAGAGVDGTNGSAIITFAP